MVGDSAEYAVLENPGQSNHDLRVTALIAYMEKNYPNMKLVGRQATNQDTRTRPSPPCRRCCRPILILQRCGFPKPVRPRVRWQPSRQSGDKLMIIHADVTPTTLEEIKAGNIHMALNPNQGVQGFLGFMNTFLGARPELIDPFNDYKVSGFNPMQFPYSGQRLCRDHQGQCRQLCA